MDKIIPWYFDDLRSADQEQQNAAFMALLDATENLVGDENIKPKALAVIENEDGPKCRKKYLNLWKTIL